MVGLELNAEESYEIPPKPLESVDDDDDVETMASDEERLREISTDLEELEAADAAADFAEGTALMAFGEFAIVLAPFVILSLCLMASEEEAVFEQELSRVQEQYDQETEKLKQEIEKEDKEQESYDDMIKKVNERARKRRQHRDEKKKRRDDEKKKQEERKYYY